MKRFIPVAIAALAIGTSIVFGMFREYTNPDPNHTHADFAVWINDQKLDFAADRYMSEAYVEGQQVRVNPMRKYLHLHDGNGHVIHSHKPGQTLGDFFASLDLSMTTECITLDDTQYAALDAGWKDSFGITNAVCTNGKFHWQMIVNGDQLSMNPEYVFKDEDKILLFYTASDVVYIDLWDEMTSDACLYSKTCPWRGEPPAENCISDPTIPCVVPE